MAWTKDPDAVLDYMRDWGSDALDPDARWLRDDDTILTSTWIVPDGITKDSDTHDDKTATIWLSGGTLGESYELTNRVVTAGGRTDERSVTIIIRDR